MGERSDSTGGAGGFGISGHSVACDCVPSGFPNDEQGVDPPAFAEDSC